METFSRSYNIVEATTRWKKDTLADLLASDFERMVVGGSDARDIVVTYTLSGNKYLINQGD